MDSKIKIGVYVCSCGLGFEQFVNVDDLSEFAKTLPSVVVSRSHGCMCSKNGQDLIISDIQSNALNRIVIAACSPDKYEPIFKYACEKAGLNPGLLEMVDFGKESDWLDLNNTELAFNLAKDYIRTGIIKASDLEPVEILSIPIEPSCLVVGAGIAGMNAALDLANRGFDVHLVEKQPSIGGRMAQLDKTFPTLDCSACILTPRMSDVRNENKIHLYTYSEVVATDGYVGNYNVLIKKNPHFIDQQKCTGCGTCATECPVECGNEFDLCMKERKAVYIPFPQAVPGQYTIDMNNCIKCGICKDVCPAQAVNYDDEPEYVKLKVGTIIITTGWDPYDPTELKQYGYGKYSNVITGPQMERLLSSFGPTGGKIKRPSDHKEPESVVFLQCVGSRDFRKLGNKYCSRVCCMYAIKQARQFKEKHPKAQVITFYIDLRAFGKGYEEFYESAAREYGIYFVRGRVGEMYEDKSQNLIIRAEDTLLQRFLELKTDLVVLSTGLVPRTDSEEVAQLFNLLKSEDGFFMEAHPQIYPVDTLNQGIFVAGAAQGPKDIPDTVAQAKGAASGAAALMASGKIKIASTRIVEVKPVERVKVKLESEQINSLEI